MNTVSIHQVTNIVFAPVQYLSSNRPGQDSYYVTLTVTQQVPYSEEYVQTQVVLHSDKPLRLDIPD